MLIRAASTVLKHSKWQQGLSYCYRGFAQEVTVLPYCKIEVKTMCPLIVRPFDLLGNPAGNTIKATLAKNQTQLEISLDNNSEENDGQQVVRISEKLTKFLGQDEIVLEVPVQVDLAIENGDSVSVSNIESDFCDIQSITSIRTQNIKGDNIKLKSGGSIQCENTVLARSLVVQTEQDGVGCECNIVKEYLLLISIYFQDIQMDKILGDRMSIQTEQGNVSINSCYSQSSKIRTKSGNLTLKNIHRNCEVNVEQESNLTMTGFNGNLLITMDSGYIDLQIAELHGESVIVANNSADMDIKLSEEVATSTYVHAAVKPKNLHLDDNLEPVRGSKESGASTLNMGGLPNQLFIQTDGVVRIKQQSWADSMFGGPEM